MRWKLTLLVLVATLAVPLSASAQLPRRSRETRTFEPARQPFSNYLNLLRTNIGPLPNYQQFLRRNENVSRQFNQLNRGLRQTQKETIELNREFQQQLDQQEERESLLIQRLPESFPGLQLVRPRIRPTGTGSRYNSYQLQYSGNYYGTR